MVGSGQSGSQIADELYQRGRKVYFPTVSAVRMPRFYRGRDTIYWLGKTGFFNQTVDLLPSPKARFVANPFLSGMGGGRSLNLHRFARDGFYLLGRLHDAGGYQIRLAPDLHENLAKQGEFLHQIKQDIDEYIIANRIEADKPAEEPEWRDGYHQGSIDELELQATGISAIIFGHGIPVSF